MYKLDIFFGCVLTLIALMVLSAFALANEVERVAEEVVMEEGFSVLWTALAAFITGVGGWFVKGWHHERGETSQTPSADAQRLFDKVSHDLEMHEEHCEAYRKEQREEIRRIHARIDDNAKDTADIKADVSYLRGKAEKE